MPRTFLSDLDFRVTAAPNAFPAGVSPMGGEAQGGQGNPKHEGPPPAAQAARPGRPGGRVCPECMQRVEDGQELKEHLRTEHQVRGRKN